jgi:hypothetical protein
MEEEFVVCHCRYGERWCHFEREKENKRPWIREDAEEAGEGKKRPLLGLGEVEPNRPKYACPTIYSLDP